MKALLLLLLFGCASKSPSPSWVDGVRTGEERLTVQNGNKLLFRRIAGTGAAPDQACQAAIFHAEQDIRLSRPDLENVPYSVEVLYYDPHHQDCAVTLAVNPHKRGRNSVRQLVQHRLSLAEKYAITGLEMDKFMSLAKVKIINLDIDFRNQCWQNFYKSGASYHGPVTICWKEAKIVGYCKSGVCTSK